MKKIIVIFIALLIVSGVKAQDEVSIPSKMTSSEYIRLSRSQSYVATEKKLNNDYKAESFKKGMKSKELRRRNRSLAYQVAGRVIEGSNESTGFEGVLKNYKNLPVQFNITRTDIKGTINVSHLLGPEKELIISLLSGTYQVELVCLSERVVYPLEVRPGAANSLEGQKVYWYAYCNRN